MAYMTKATQQSGGDQPASKYMGLVELGVAAAVGGGLLDWAGAEAQIAQMIDMPVLQAAVVSAAGAALGVALLEQLYSRQYLNKPKTVDTVMQAAIAGGVGGLFSQYFLQDMIAQQFGGGSPVLAAAATTGISAVLGAVAMQYLPMLGL